MTVSCNKLLDINPKQSIDSSVALSSQEGIDAALTSVYSRLQNYTLYGRDILALSEALSDNAIHTGNSSHLIGESTNNRNAHFYAINQANLIIDALESGSFDENWKANILGQAHFLRALIYHDLVRAYSYDPTANIPEYNYGGVPLMLVGVNDISKIGSLKRPSVDDVYNQIYKDLDQAHNFLSSNNNTSIHLATKAAVSALYSRVALYRGDYEKCISMSDRAISESVAIQLHCCLIGGKKSTQSLYSN